MNVFSTINLIILYRRFHPFRFLTVLGATLCLLAGALNARAVDQYWQGQSIYQIITDRFFDGDPSNNNADGNYNPSNAQSVHGGDFKGIEQKLDYIKALGATAIWISPVIQNTEGQFHGYSGMNFYQVAPHWGSLSNLQHLVQAAHARGLLVIDDIVVNHAGDFVTSSDSGYPSYLGPPSGYNLKFANSSKTYPVPFNLTVTNPSLTNLFHNYGNIGTCNDVTQTQLGQLSGLNDFRTETTYVQQQMEAIYEYWIGTVGFDAFRIDTVLEVDMGFWQNWCPAVHAYAGSNGLPHFFMFGEVENGSETTVGSYTGTEAGGPYELDSTLDYPLYFTVNSVFANATGNTRQIETHSNNVNADYDVNAQMKLVTFLDNHDQPRFLSSGNANNNTARLDVALAFLYTARGIPCLYYGTEQAFNGGADPNNREDMFAGQFKDGAPGVDSFNMSHPLFQLVAKLNNFRRLYPALLTGTHVNRWNDPDSPGLFAYEREFGAQEVFVVFNTAGSSQTLTNRSTTYPAGTVLVNLLNTNETITTVAGPLTPQITVPATTAKIFIAQSQLLPLDPVIVSNFPAHAATNVPTSSPIVLQFSKPMNTNSVQSAFSITPSVSGAFSWSAAHDVMTFTPGGIGLAGLSTIYANLTNTALDAVSGNAFFSPYQLMFSTAATSEMVPPTISILTPTNNTVAAGMLVVSGTATDNFAVQKVEISLDGGAWAIVTGTNSWNYSLNTSNFLNGPHTLSARATDTSGNLSATNSVSLRFINVPGAYLQRLSGGNPNNVIDCSGNTWLRDTAYTLGNFGYSGGATGYVANTVVGICAGAQALYQRERFSNTNTGYYYEFDCPEGVYETTLLEAETYWTGPGQRQFNVFIQGAQVLTNFDIYAAAGGMNLPLTEIFTNNVTNSQLRVLLTPVIDNARVSGIQARKLADIFSDTDGIPDWWRLAYFGHPTGQAADLSRGSDDPDGDGASNLSEYLAGTDPLNPASFFKISSLATIGANLQVSWPTTTNRTYQLQRADSLVPPIIWTNIGPPLNATGGIVTQTDTNASINTAHYYRIQKN